MLWAIDAKNARKAFTCHVLIYHRTFSSLKVLVYCIPHCLIAIVIISTILADRDDVAAGSRHDNQTSGKRRGVLPLLALVWDDSLLGNARNRHSGPLDSRRRRSDLFMNANTSWKIEANWLMVIEDERDRIKKTMSLSMPSYQPKLGQIIFLWHKLLSIQIPTHNLCIYNTHLYLQ